MSKKQSPTDQSYTLSTRLSADQKDLIDRAAEACDMTPAKLLRVAALKHASDVLNAQHPNDQAIHELARSLCEKITNINATTYGPGRYPEQGVAKKSVTASDGSFSSEDLKNWGFDTADYPHLERIEIEMLTPQDIQELKQVLDRTPNAFAEALIKEFNSPRKGRIRFAPVDIDTSDTEN